MQLQLLYATSCLSIYDDSRHQGLFLEWAGELTLPAVQEACVAVAQCYLTRMYPRVLTSNLQVTKVGDQVGKWFSAEFLPYLTVVGVEQLAWVKAPSWIGSNQAQPVGKQPPTLCLNWFNNTDEAIAWLRQPRAPQLEAYLLPLKQPTTHVRLAQGVEVIRQEAHLIRQEVQYLKQKVSTSSRA